MVYRRLPPLNALKAFEAAARHSSLTLAAKELHVTQGAVSRQVKNLEHDLGVPLFKRLHRKIVLTDAGQALLPHLTQMFDRLAEVTRNLAQRERVLTLRVQPTFALRWLLSRLPKFQSANPDIKIRLMIESQSVDFRTDDIDAAIVYGSVEKPGIKLEPIYTEWVTPVCAPGLLVGSRPLLAPSDLGHHRLLLNSSEQIEWRKWAEVAGVDNLPLNEGQVFDIDDAAYQAAAAGHGVAIGDMLLIKDDLSNGVLVAPFPAISAKIATYHFATPSARPFNAAAALLKEWLLTEIAQQ